MSFACSHPKKINHVRMKLIVVLCMVSVAAAAPPPDNYYNPGYAQIIRYEDQNDGNGYYRFGFEQTDGTSRDEEGTVTNQGQEDESIAVKGSYSWLGPDGVTYLVKYTADDDGFKPEIEQGPGGGIPPAVVASLLG